MVCLTPEVEDACKKDERQGDEREIRHDRRKIETSNREKNRFSFTYCHLVKLKRYFRHLQGLEGVVVLTLGSFVCVRG